ncbi:TauD-domain-containing protein [Ophiobolus disseminans]|uniref:TauD-domain-containing protein n=1 Tax=Ophiobolus disseminans TaxID=1469910 RepID=A0A6A7AEN1_9PLEO|nr:TauD-domain-containing protein [Ophiobolus disseminans]
MAVHRSRRPTSSDSGYSSTDSLASHVRIKDFSTSQTVDDVALNSSEDESSSIDVASLLQKAIRTDLATSIGTQLFNVQVSDLTSQQLDELALLVSDRGVVVFRDQSLSREQQSRIFEHYGKTAGEHGILKERGSTQSTKSAKDVNKHDDDAQQTKSEWVSDRSWEPKPPSYSMLNVDEAGGDTSWVSQYGLYDALSAHMKRFVDDLQAKHTSHLLPSFPTPSISNVHPAVRTHPVTGLKALNATPGAVTGFVQLSRRESDNLLQLLEHNINASDEHTVRFHWEAGSVALWDNRCTAFKHISTPKGFQTSCVGEKPYLDPHSESRTEKAARIQREEKDEKNRLEEIKRRYNDTPLRRILKRQNSKAPLYLYTTQVLQDERDDTAANEEEKEQKPYVFRLRSSSEIREKEKEIWAQTSTEVQERKPLFNLRSASEMRMYEEVIWAKSTNPASATLEEEVEDKGRPAAIRVNSNGSPLRRIIQRQNSGSPGARK